MDISKEREKKKKRSFFYRSSTKAGAVIISCILVFLLMLSGVYWLIMIDAFGGEKDTPFEETSIFLEYIFKSQAFEEEDGSDIFNENILIYEKYKNQMDAPVFNVTSYSENQNQESQNNETQEEKKEKTQKSNPSEAVQTYSMQQLIDLFGSEVSENTEKEDYDVYSLKTSKAQKYTDFISVTTQQYVELIKKYGVKYQEFRKTLRDSDEFVWSLESVGIDVNKNSYIYKYYDLYATTPKYLIYSEFKDDEESVIGRVRRYDPEKDEYLGMTELREKSVLLFPKEKLDFSDEIEKSFFKTDFCGFASLGSIYAASYMKGENDSQIAKEDTENTFWYSVSKDNSEVLCGNHAPEDFTEEKCIFITKYDISNNAWQFDPRYDEKAYHQYLSSYVDTVNPLGDGYVITFGIDKKVMQENAVKFLKANYDFFKKNMNIFIGIIIASAVSLFILLVYFFFACGRSGWKDKEVLTLKIDKWYVEIRAMLIFVFGLFVFAIVGCSYHYYSDSILYDDSFVYGNWYFLISIVIAVILTFLVEIMGMFIYSIVRTVKENAFSNQCICCKIIRKIISVAKRMFQYLKIQMKYFAESRGYRAKIILLYGAYLFFNLIFIIFSCALASEVPILLPFVLIPWIAFHIFVVLMMLKDRKGIVKITEGAKELADGNLDAVIEKQDLYGEQLELAKIIDTIGDGLQKAIEQSVKDERLKAELITNVSHDIKTPLTSIINYVDLLKMEKIENERAREYLDILEQKSQRLKQLTLDLIEASKVSTGNIELERIPLNMKELMNQVAGEFKDKLEENGLQLVENIEEAYPVIIGDNRRTYRIFANLLQNVCKYSMSGSRVYMDLYKENHMVKICIRNISKDPLTKSSEEFLERFARGEASRTTEGNGLGLSIAKDLTKLQGGEFEIIIDGDLFKVIVSLPEATDMIGK